jgi:Cu-Zn family superoxide dismutase
MKLQLIGTALAIILAAPASAQNKSETAKASFVNTEGKQIGTATLTQTPSGVLIQTEISGLPPGEHAFHVHASGKCEPANQFKSAGDHFDPRGHKHGYETVGGPHAGDMPNQFVSQDGMLKADVINPNVTLRKGEGSVFDRDGSALVVHAKADDYRSQPSGEAGDRLACAVIEK